MLADRVLETTTTTGTSNITLLGATTGYNTFNAYVTVGPFCDYTIETQTPGEWEVGLGYLSSSTILVRYQIYTSSNSNNPVSFSAGTKNVFVTASARTLNDMQSLAQAHATALSF